MSKAESECWLRKLQSSCPLNKSRHRTLRHSAVTGFNLEHLIYLLWTGGLYKEFFRAEFMVGLIVQRAKEQQEPERLLLIPVGSPSKARTKWWQWRGARGAFSWGGTEFVGLVWDYTEYGSRDQVSAFVPLALPWGSGIPLHKSLLFLQRCWCLGRFWC